MNNTFKDVKKFLESAEVTMVGLHYMNETYPKRMVHIYDSKNECNVHLEMSADMTEQVIVGKLYFVDEAEVYMIRVENGIADFDHPVNVPMDTDINDKRFALTCSQAFGVHAPIMLNVIRDMALSGMTAV